MLKTNGLRDILLSVRGPGGGTCFFCSLTCHTRLFAKRLEIVENKKEKAAKKRKERKERPKESRNRAPKSNGRDVGYGGLSENAADGIAAGVELGE